MLAVSADREIDTARQVKVDEGLDYRAWWDGPFDGPPLGPIATAWSVDQWPTTYLIDAEGVVRRVNVLGEALVTAARALVGELGRGRGDD